MAGPDQKRSCDFWREGAQGKQDPLGSALQREGHRETLKRGTETYQRLGRDLGAQACACQWHTAGLLTKKLRGNKYTEGTGGSDPTRLANRGQNRVENSGQTPCERAAGLISKAGAECLRFASQSESLSQTSKPNPHLWEALQSSKVRPRSFLQRTFPQGKEEKGPSPATTCYTAPWP